MEHAIGALLPVAEIIKTILRKHIESIAPYNGYYYSDLTSLGLHRGDWLIIEPQATIENQHTGWILEWTIEADAEV